MTVSFLVRNFYMPNPFADYELGIVYNYIAGILLLPITYRVVGLFYRRGTAPAAVGSFLFLFFYVAHTYLLLFLGKFNFNKYVVVIVIVLYTVLLIGSIILKYRRRRIY